MTTTPESPSTKNISIRISAPGKVILHGEHSVVYDKLALAASLGLRTRLEFDEITSTENGPLGVSLDLPAVDLRRFYHLQDVKNLLEKSSNFDHTKPESLDFDGHLSTVETFIAQQESLQPLNSKQHQALSAFFCLFAAILGPNRVVVKPFRVTVKSELAISAGTGSSASYSVTIAAALLRLLRLKTTPSNNVKSFDASELELVSKWGFVAERIIHGKPSGIDNTICTYGSMVEFRKTSVPRLVALKTKFDLLLINTNVPRNTKAMVEKVAELRGRHPAIVDAILESMDRTAIGALTYWKKINETSASFDNYVRLGELVDVNQNLLRCLGVSHEKLDEICRILTRKGLHGKLTGAGGGGYAVCLVPPDFDPEIIQGVVNELNCRGFNAVFTNLGGAGVTID